MDGDSVWPIIRFKINEELRNKRGLNSRTVKLNIRLVFTLIRTLFYGFKEVTRFRNYEFWVFSSSDRRRKIYDKYVDRVMEPILNEYPNAVEIENPHPLGHHYSKKELNNKNIISQTIFFLGVKIIGLFLNRKVELENESELNKILKDIGVTLNYRALLLNHKSQYLFMRFLLRFAKPKAVFFVYAASSMGFIKALKEMNVPVVELQHGVINELHYAYNVYKDFGYKFFPDFLLTYGKMETKIFTTNNYFIDSNRVLPIGYYFLEEFILSNVANQNAKKLKNEFDKIIVFSLQDPFEKHIFDFLSRAAPLDTSILYLLVPRNPMKTYGEYELPNNIRIERRNNIYECLKIADFHMTINSTCAIESICFGVPNILYDYNNWASKYYNNILNDTGHTIFVNSPKDLLNSVRKHVFYVKEKIEKESSNFIKKGFTENLKNAIESKIL